MLNHKSGNVQYTLQSQQAYEFDSKGFAKIGKICDNCIGQMIDLVSQKDQPKFEFINLDPLLFTEMWSDRQFLQMLRLFCGDWVRYDGHFGVTIPGVNNNIHGGPGSHQQSTWYIKQNGRIITTNLKVGISLSESDEFGYLPGSHKSLDIQEGKAANPGKYVDVELLERPLLTVGDLFIFTDALLHGTLGQTPRQTLYYTFTPGFVCLHKHSKPNWYDQIPEDRQRLVREAGVAYPDQNNRAIIQEVERI